MTTKPDAGQKVNSSLTRPADLVKNSVFIKICVVYCLNPAMDMPSELTALNITPRGALLRWNPPLSVVDNYVLTLTHNQGKGVEMEVCDDLMNNLFTVSDLILKK